MKFVYQINFFSASILSHLGISPHSDLVNMTLNRLSSFVFYDKCDGSPYRQAKLKWVRYLTCVKFESVKVSDGIIFPNHLPTKWGGRDELIQHWAKFTVLIKQFTLKSILKLAGRWLQAPIPIPLASSLIPQRLTIFII